MPDSDLKQELRRRLFKGIFVNIAHEVNTGVVWVGLHYARASN